MRRAGWLVVLAILGWGLWASADCGCAQGLEPPCYVTFRANDWVGFEAVFPLDFFEAHSTTETPFVLGWAIEAADGALLRNETFDDVTGWWQEFVWNLKDDAGNDVAPGFYRILVVTTAGVVTADVRVVSCCTPCTACWSCCLCSTCPRAGGGHCPRPRGEAYLELDVAATQPCCSFAFPFFGN